MSTDRYRTIAREGTAQLREKASRFIGIAFHIHDEGDFKERLHAFTREHHGARHFCYAWVLGLEGDLQRANDAGEPAGTAGRPILNRIQGAGLTYCGVVVVRYFGGTLLGKAGLVHAYGGTAALALADATTMEVPVCDQLQLDLTYAQLEPVRSTVLRSGGAVTNMELTDRCRIIVEVPRNAVQPLIDLWHAQGILAQRMDQGK